MGYPVYYVQNMLFENLFSTVLLRFGAHRFYSYRLGIFPDNAMQMRMEQN